MPEPVTYQSKSPRHSLPLLFTAQAQKEVILNESLGRLDALLHLAVQGEANDPPSAPEEGQSWIIGNAPTGAWESHTGAVAAWFAGDWLFIEPHDGMTCWDTTRGQFVAFADGWQAPARPSNPAGGQTVDAESRQAIDAIIAALATAGIVAF